MRPLLVAVLALSLVDNALAQRFPLPLAPERAVSDIVLSGAAGGQHDVRVGTNGAMSLMAWQDDRTPSYVYAARLDDAGKLLDPLGVPIAQPRGGANVNAVVWNGESFVLIIGPDLAFVTPQMEGTVRLGDPPMAFIAATTGPDLRILYMTRGKLAVRDGHGAVVATRAADTWTGTDDVLVGGGSEDGFVVLRSLRDYAFGPARLVSDRYDRDGNLVSSKPAGLPVPEGQLALAGGADGFLLAQARGGLAAYFLDSSGVFHNRSRGFELADTFWPSVVREESRYLVACRHGDVDAIAEIGFDGTAVLHDYPNPAGRRANVAIASYGGRRLLVTTVDRPEAATGYDIYARQLSPSLSAPEAFLVTHSATQQYNAGVAAGVNGFAVTWGEIGPDASVRIYVRRFSEAGVPQDGAPVVVYEVSDSLLGYPPRASIASNGETYVLGWLGREGALFRRFSARTGAWVDDAPVPLLMKGQVHLASNGKDALALTDGIPYAGEGPMARRINLSGPPLTSDAVLVRPLGYGYGTTSEGIAIEANGSDYLAVWTEWMLCVGGCIGPSMIFAKRLHEDGTPIDSTPLSLDGTERYQSYLSIASTEGRWLVTWRCEGLGAIGTCATRISEGGVLLDRDANGWGVLIEPAYGDDNSIAVATHLGSRFALLTRHYIRDWSTSPPTLGTRLTGMIFDSNADRIGWWPIGLPQGEHAELPVALAPRQMQLATVYTRSVDEAGGVQRAFLRLYSEPARQRASRH